MSKVTDYKILPFESCIEKVKYTTKISSKDFKESGRFPIISQEEAFINGYWDSPEDVFHITRPVVIFGDHSRHIKYVDFDFVIGADGVKILSPVDDINAKYLYYYLIWLDIPSLGYSRHYKSLKEKIVKVFTIEEQQRIVAELDLLTSIIDKKNAQLRDLDALAQSIYYEMFGEQDFVRNRLVELCASPDDIKCGPFGTQLSKDEFQETGVAVWGIPQINSNFAVPPADYISEEKAASLDSYSLIPGDIVMSRKGNIGQSAVFPDSFKPGVLHSDALRIRMRSDLANAHYYVYQFHLSPYIRHQLMLIGHGAIMPGLNVTKLKGIDVEMPPIELQQAFAERIAAIEHQKSLLRESLAATQTLLASRMDHYFSE